MLSGHGWDSPALLQLVVHRPANAREDGVRGHQLLPTPSVPGSQRLEIHCRSLPQSSAVWQPCAGLGHLSCQVEAETHGELVGDGAGGQMLKEACQVAVGCKQR